MVKIDLKTGAFWALCGYAAVSAVSITMAEIFYILSLVLWIALIVKESDKTAFDISKYILIPFIVFIKIPLKLLAYSASFCSMSDSSLNFEIFSEDGTTGFKMSKNWLLIF